VTTGKHAARCFEFHNRHQRRDDHRGWRDANFYRDTGTTSALAGLTTNAAAGSFTIDNGYVFTPIGSFTNSGTVTIGTGSLFGHRGGESATSGIVSAWPAEGNANDSQRVNSAACKMA